MKNLKMFSRASKKIKLIRRATNIKKIKLNKERLQAQSKRLSDKALLEYYQEYNYAKSVVQSFDDSNFKIKYKYLCLGQGVLK